MKAPPMDLPMRGFPRVGDPFLGFLILSVVELYYNFGIL